MHSYHILDTVQLKKNYQSIIFKKNCYICNIIVSICDEFLSVNKQKQSNSLKSRNKTLNGNINYLKNFGRYMSLGVAKL